MGMTLEIELASPAAKKTALTTRMLTAQNYTHNLKKSLMLTKN
jgi:hypothetical protein